MAEIELVDLGIDRCLRRILTNLQDGTDLARVVGEEMVLATDERFKAEVDPDGSPWALLPEKYVEWKRRKGFITKRLQMRGDLRAKITYVPYSDRVEIGADLPYAARQHRKRPYLYSKNGGLGREDERRLARAAEEYLRGLVE